MIQRSHKLLTTYITSAIIGDLLDDSEATEYTNQTDKAVMQAIALLAANKSVPTVGKQQAMLFTKMHNNYYALTTKEYTPFTKRSGLTLPFALQSNTIPYLPYIGNTNADYNNILALCYRKWTFAWS